MREAEDLEVLFPDWVVRVGDEDITVREFTFRESLDLSGKVRPILESMVSLTGPEAEPDPFFLDEVLRQHFDLFLELLALATGKPMGWLLALPNRDGERLLWAFWRANESFFLHRLVLLRAHRYPAKPAAPSAPPSSSPP